MVRCLLEQAVDLLRLLFESKREEKSGSEIGLDQGARAALCQRKVLWYSECDGSLAVCALPFFLTFGRAGGSQKLVFTLRAGQSTDRTVDRY